MTDHPCKGLSKKQRDAFEAIAISMDRAEHQKTIEALLKRGLIVRGDDKVLGRDHFGLITVPTYYVPLPIHAQWCEWCSEQQDAEVV